MNDIFTQSASAPTVYFIDDSATMREVIKMAFRKENINVIACHDAASAITQFAHIPPDAVITDVIMPDKDGYEVCQFVKQHPDLQSIPVILMSGVVNRAVAEKAMTVNADELIRKPFQPQDLIARVKNLLHPKKNAGASPAIADGPKPAAAVLTHVFGNAGGPAPGASPVAAQRPIPAPAPAATASFAASPFRAPVPVPTQAQAAPPRPGAHSPEVLKLRGDVMRLELLVKKLQAELEAERQYCAALESQFQAVNQRE
jgi:CheY-like chemotaxis protein